MNRNQLHAHIDAGFRQVDPRQAIPSTVARSFILAATFIVIVTAENYLSGGFSFDEVLAHRPFGFALTVVAMAAGVALLSTATGGRRSPAGGLPLAILLALVIAASLLMLLGGNAGYFEELFCLQAGVAIGSTGAFLFWAMTRCWSPRESLSSDSAVGLMGGLTGAAALYSHCPLPDASHQLVIHVGSLAITTALTAGLGAVGRRMKIRMGC